MQAAREAFERKLFSTSPRQRRWANYDDLNGLTHAPRLQRLAGEFRRGELGERTAPRCHAWRAALELGVGARDVLELFLAIVKVGLMGTIAEQGEIARHVDRLVNRCRVRKARYSLAELVAGGWLDAQPLPTGRRAERADGRWCTCQVIQYTAAPKLLSLLSGAPSKRIGQDLTNGCGMELRSAERGRVVETALSPAPSRDELDAGAGVDQVDEGSAGETSSSAPRQNLPTIGREEPAPPLVPHGGAELRYSGHTETPASSSSRDGAGESAVSTTRPRSAELERDSRTTPREPRGQAAESLEVGSGSRPRVSARWRRHAARTWRQGRRALLEDLALQLEQLEDLAAGNVAQVLAAAAAQTAASYNRELGAAVEWDPLVFSWLDLPAAERADELRYRVIPAVRSWLAPLARARDLELQATAATGIAERRADRLRRLSDRQLNPPAPAPRIDVPELELEQLVAWLPLARTIARGVALGTFELEGLAPDVRARLSRCVEVFGELVGESAAGGRIRTDSEHAGVNQVAQTDPERVP